MPLEIVRNDITKMTVDAIVNAAGEGTHILYESVAKAVCNVRASAPLGADWSKTLMQTISAEEKRISS